MSSTSWSEGTGPVRPPTTVDAVADAYFDASVALSPIALTELGMPERQDELDDLSPEGLETRVNLARHTLRELDTVTPVDAIDEVTVHAMRERLGLAVEMHDAGLDLGSINVLTSGLHAIRGCFDLMPTETPEHWDTLARRLHAIPDACEQWFATQHEGAARGIRPARRQVAALAEQCRAWTAPGGYYDGLLANAAAASTTLSADTQRAIADGVDRARVAFTAAAERLEQEFAGLATETDACGIERYQLYSREFLGARVDLAETYAWGLEELQRITAMMEHTADKIRPGASVKEAVAALDADPAYRLHGTRELQEWMQAKADQAVDELAGTHFDIPEPIRRIQCRIAPTQDGGIYYTGPSDDFSRPGRMWWSVPPGVETFGTWRELTTVYHEGVPGHHLQVAQTTYRRDTLNKWRRLGTWTSGHGEGWALYAEWLMADLGYMDDPGNRLGLLDGQSLRATRVVIDIGVHCGFPAPDEVGGGDWTYDKAWEFLRAHTNMEEQMSRFELHRYLGWPGQAPSYKVGERLWLQIRDEVMASEGAAFDLRAFHRRALDVGSVGLDTLRFALR